MHVIRCEAHLSLVGQPHLGHRDSAQAMLPGQLRSAGTTTAAAGTQPPCKQWLRCTAARCERLHFGQGRRSSAQHGLEGDNRELLWLSRKVMAIEMPSQSCSQEHGFHHEWTGCVTERALQIMAQQPRKLTLAQAVDARRICCSSCDTRHQVDRYCRSAASQWRP